VVESEGGLVAVPPEEALRGRSPDTVRVGERTRRVIERSGQALVRSITSRAYSPGEQRSRQGWSKVWLPTPCPARSHARGRGTVTCGWLNCAPEVFRQARPDHGHSFAPVAVGEPLHGRLYGPGSVTSSALGEGPVPASGPNQTRTRRVPWP
jgi:hypothetical protein